MRATHYRTAEAAVTVEDATIVKLTRRRLPMLIDCPPGYWWAGCVDLERARVVSRLAPPPPRAHRTDPARPRRPRRRQPRCRPGLGSRPQLPNHRATPGPHPGAARGGRPDRRAGGGGGTRAVGGGRARGAAHAHAVRRSVVRDAARRPRGSAFGRACPGLGRGH